VVALILTAKWIEIRPFVILSDEKILRIRTIKVFITFSEYADSGHRA
jgi:hypothetical protein